MIVLGALCKNDQLQLHRMLESAHGFVESIVVVDTGSDDFALTQRIFPGAVQHEWCDFGTNWTRLLRLMQAATWNPDRPGQYGLILHADMELVRRGDLPELTADAYMLEVLDGSPETYRLPLLVNLAKPELAYVGKTHEYLAGLTNQVDLDELAVRHYCDGSRRPVKMKEDLELLHDAYQENPHDPRTVFYLANTLRDLGRHQEAMVFYKIRAGMGGWQAEAKCALESYRRLAAGDHRPVQVPT